MPHLNLSGEAYPVPEYIESWVQTGLETGEQGDRLTALIAANAFDVEHEGARLGVRVVAAFMDQAELGFMDTSRQLGRPNLWKLAAQGPAEAKLNREVAQAVGSRLGISTVIHEIISKEKEMATMVLPTSHDRNIYVVTGFEEQIVSVGGFRYGCSLGFEPGKPFSVLHVQSHRGSSVNFSRALEAVSGKAL